MTDPVHDPLPRYSFLPWARRGIAASIDEVDHLGFTPAAGPPGRATVTASVTVVTTPVPGAPAYGPAAVSQTVGMVGPGDVKAFQAKVVLRAVPTPGVQNATPGELACVEFYDEDFPWRYTPARATADHRLRPWLALLVFAEGEYTLLTRPGETSILVVTATGKLPPATETWAWAHVQTSGDLGAVDDLDRFVTQAPDHALSRLASPRRLRPLTTYHAFVVPAFESGRLAGLGLPDLAVPAQRQSWGDGQPARFPVLYDWAFRTADVSDFESLARRPLPFVAGQHFGKRAIDVSAPGAGLPGAAGVELEGALEPIGFQRTGFPDSPGAALRDKIRDLVDRGADYRDGDPATQPADPVITPPAYARVPPGLARITGAASPQFDWLLELNADPRNRAAAGLGAEIVRQRDDELMARAWAQVDEIDAVNQRLREADLAIATSERIFAKHVAGGDSDRLLQLTAAAQPAIAIDGTTSVRGMVDASRVPAAAQSTTFRRITRPQRSLIRTISGTALRTGLIDGLNREASPLTTAPPAPDPATGVAMSLITSAVAAAASQQATPPVQPREPFLHISYDEVVSRGGGAVQPVTDHAGLGTLRTALSGRLDTAFPPLPAGTPPDNPMVVLRAGVQTIIDAIKELRPDGTDQAVVSITQDVFSLHFGKTSDGKTYRGVTVAPEGSALLNTTSSTDHSSVAEFVTAMDAFTADIGSRTDAPIIPALPEPPTTIAMSITSTLHPRAALPARLKTVLRGADDATDAIEQTRRLRPVLAHPRFPDPLFEPLQRLGQDYVLPNIADLEPEKIALMQPNGRFIEAVMAGASTEMARELLWNEYPTDQRGTYFSRFWDARDAGVDNPPPDIRDLADWSGELGAQSGRSAGLLVLVVRAELVVKFPNTVVFAQHGKYVAGGRTLDDAGDVKYPVLRGHLDPDIELYGFELSITAAKGTATDAGYFICFMERPGQIRFGLDVDEPAPPLSTWDDLNWANLRPADTDLVTLGGPNATLAPTTPDLPPWNRTAAHQAAILCQSPVLLARHATDMLP